MEGKKQKLFVLFIVLGVLTAVPAISYVSYVKWSWGDLLSVDSPKPGALFDYHPVEIVVSFKNNAIANTFRASLNGKDITGIFTAVPGGVHAFVTPEDGLKSCIIGKRNPSAGVNMLLTSIEGYKNKREKKNTPFRVVYYPVRTVRDNKGVWFITGGSLGDVMEAMGYAVATDRLWQMEKYRRSARGTLSEVFGSDQLTTDKFLRTLGYTDQELTAGFNALDKQGQIEIRSYVKGINRRIAEIKAKPALTPFEFLATGCPLTNWSEQDILAWGALMLREFDCEALETGQIGNLTLFKKLTAPTAAGGYGPLAGYGMFNDLRWVNDPAALTYIPPASTAAMAMRLTSPDAGVKASGLKGTSPGSADFKDVSEDLISKIRTVKKNLKKINAAVKMGSYAWTVSGRKTASHRPIIYSGPQMGFEVPSIILEGSIRGGGLDISGMAIPGLPGIVIGRTPHHAWSMQVGHARTVDYYLDTASSIISSRTETIHVKDAPDETLPVYRTSHGPVIAQSSPYLITWKYSHWGYEFQTIPAYLKLARAQSMDDFAKGIEEVGVSQHFCYADRDGNIAYWMSGRNPVRPAEGEWRLPQGALGTQYDWDSAVLTPRSTDRNNAQGYYCGWNNKTSATYDDSVNSVGYFFGPFHRAHVVNDYLKANNHLTYEEVRDLALYIASTDSFGGGGIPWEFVRDYFTSAILNAGPNAQRESALEMLDEWDGHFVAGGPSEWAQGVNRADAWILQDAWIREVLRLTFQDELTFTSMGETEETSTFSQENENRLFNVLLHGLAGSSSGIINTYNWFQNLADPSAPQTPDAIIVQALDTALAALGSQPWGTGQRGVITYTHDILGPVHTMPFSSRSTYAHCVEFGKRGPVRIESMFPLGESGTILFNGTDPVFNANFFSMTPVFDPFTPRPFPLFY